MLYPGSRMLHPSLAPQDFAGPTFSPLFYEAQLFLSFTLVCPFVSSAAAAPFSGSTKSCRYNLLNLVLSCKAQLFLYSLCLSLCPNTAPCSGSTKSCRYNFVPFRGAQLFLLFTLSVIMSSRMLHSSLAPQNHTGPTGSTLFCSLKLNCFYLFTVSVIMSSRVLHPSLD